MREWVVLLSIVSIPAFAADWGRYTNTYIAPPVLAEIQIIRTPDIRLSPDYLSQKAGGHPNKSFNPSTPWFAAPPPAIGSNTKSGK